MFRIGEFSKLTQVSIRMLRYYDEAGLLKAAEVDKWTGHRIYCVTQIPRLNKILYLRDSGFNVSEIALALEMDDCLLLKTLEQKRLEIEQTIQNEQEKLQAIPEYQVLSLRRIVPTYYSESDLWNELSAFAKKQKTEISNHTFSVYHDTEYKEQNVDIELCVPVSKLCKDITPFCFRIIEPVPVMACTLVYGDFSNIKGVYIAFAEWLQKNSKYRMSNPMRQIVHRGSWNKRNPAKYLTEIQIPLEFR